MLGRCEAIQSKGQHLPASGFLPASQPSHLSTLAHSAPLTSQQLQDNNTRPDRPERPVSSQVRGPSSPGSPAPPGRNSTGALFQPLPFTSPSHTHPTERGPAGVWGGCCSFKSILKDHWRLPVKSLRLYPHQLSTPQRTAIKS